MKNTVFALAVATLLSALPATVSLAQAHDGIYRCGNEFTNDAARSKDKGCRPLQGGSVTVLDMSPPTTVAKTGSSGGGVSSATNTPRVNRSDQRARDADARAILTAELSKAEARLESLRKEQNVEMTSGQAAEQQAPEQSAQRREGLQAAVSRAEADVEGIKRELSRLGQ